jgi:hypothetical protein
VGPEISEIYSRTILYVTLVYSVMTYEEERIGIWE